MRQRDGSGIHTLALSDKNEVFTGIGLEPSD